MGSYNSFSVSEDIVPLVQFKAQASSLLKRLKSGGRSLIITQNGKPAGVLVSPEEYDRLSGRLDFLTAVKSGMEDLEKARLVRHDEIKQEFRNRN